VPGVVRVQGEGGERQGGVPREVTPGGPPVERPPPQEVIQIGRFERMWRGARDAVRARLARRAEARRVPTAPEEYVAEAQRFLDSTLRSVGREAEVQVMIDEATRGLNPDEAAQVANNIRNATRNTADLVKLLYDRARGGRGAQETAAEAAARQTAARRALLRIYSFENVRTVMGEMAAGDRVLADALGYSRTLARQGARAAGTSVDAFLTGVSRRGFETGDVALIIQSLEAQTGARVAEISGNMVRVETQLGRVEGQLATARATPRVRPVIEAEGRVGALEGELAQARRTASETPANTPARTEADAGVQALETQLADARRVVDTVRNTVRGTRAGRTALERMDNLGEQAVNLRSQVDALNAQLRSPELQPLANAERVLGMRMTPSERAPMIQSLVDSRVLPESAIMDEFVFASRRATHSTRRLDVSAGGQEVRGQRQSNPVLENMRQSLDAGIGREGAGSVDDVLLASLRSDDLAAAVARRAGGGTRGERAASQFREAVREGDLDAVLRRMNDTLPPDMADPISGFVRSARSALAEDFAVMNLLGPRAGNVAGGGVETAVAYGQQLAPVRAQLGQMWPARAGRWLLGNVWRYPMRGLFYDIGARGVRMWRAAPPEFGGMMRLRGTMWMGGQLLIWGVAGYYAGKEIMDIYRTLSGAATIQQGREDVRRTWGVSIGEENARFVREGQGGEFFRYLPNLFPYSYTPPGNPQELRRALDRNEILIDPNRIDVALTDGRAMSGRLVEINRLLETRRAGGDGAAGATTRLTEILSGFGMTLDAADRLLTRERKQQLDITDMAELRIDDWVRRGIAIRYRDFVVETFLQDCGIPVQRGQGAAAFLTQHTDVFVFLWEGMSNGTIPINYIDDALAVLQRDGVLSGIRSRVSGTITLDSQLRETLMREHLYLEVPTGTRGQVEGIRQNSFLGILDVRASQDATFRPVFERILSAYRENPDALRAFNRFNLVEGENGEAIYGDAEALARLIIENPDTALARARTAGHVGPKVLGAMQDPTSAASGSLYYPNLEPVLVQFVTTHSRERTDEPGLRQWLIRHRAQITNMPEIVRFLSQSSQATAMDPGAIESFATQQTETFRTRGWWRGPTPTERAAAEEQARRQAGTPTGGGPGTRERTREDLLRERAVQRNPRRPGFEMAPQEQREETAAPQVQAPPQLSPESRQFYESDRAAGLGAALEGRLTRMYQDRAVGGVLRQAFGETTTDASGQVVIPQAVIAEIQAEIYRLLTSTNQREVTERAAWGIVVSGQGPTLRVEIANMRLTGEALQNYIIGYARRRQAQTPR
jgi:hypothetical protein